MINLDSVSTSLAASNMPNCHVNPIDISEKSFSHTVRRRDGQRLVIEYRFQFWSDSIRRDVGNIECCENNDGFTGRRFKRGLKVP